MRRFSLYRQCFVELVRQPIFLLLMSSAYSGLFSSVSFPFGDEPRLVKNGVLAVMMLTGLLGAVLSLRPGARRSGYRAGRVVKPVGRANSCEVPGLAALTVMPT
jgi:hypothetical protein